MATSIENILISAMRRIQRECDKDAISYWGRDTRKTIDNIRSIARESLISVAFILAEYDEDAATGDPCGEPNR